jgi:glucokinase
MHEEYLIGFDIGGTNCSVCLGDSDANFISKETFPTRSTKGFNGVFEDIVEHYYKILTHNQIDYSQISSIGISCGGPLDSKKGIILSPPNLPGWNNIEIVKQCETTFKVKTYLKNDANACALAEWKLGAGQGYENIIFCTMGTGFGAGLILNGALYEGTSNMAGEVGHVRLRSAGPEGFGKLGSFEGFCSGGGIARLAHIRAREWNKAKKKSPMLKKAKESSYFSAKLLAFAAKNKEPFAMEIFEEVGYMLGKGLAILIDILNPQIIIIGSIYVKCQKLLEPSMLKALKKEALSYSLEACKIVPAKLGEHIGHYASLMVALNGLELAYLERKK